MPNYWCVNFGGNAGEQKLRHGLANNFWLMQFQWGYQDDRVAINWNRLSQIEFGDWFIAWLTPARFHAIGKVCKPRKAANFSDSIERTVRERSHLHGNGIVHYTDAPAFYEDFTDPWCVANPRMPDGSFCSQRVDVEEWQYRSQSGVNVPGLLAASENTMRCSATPTINRDFFERVKEALIRENC